MNPLQDPLAGLRDIHLPAAPGWWPPAPGWWLLTLILLILLWFVVALILRRLNRSRPRREFEQRMKALPVDGDPDGVARTVGAMSRLVRQLAVTEFGRRRVAGLAGESWLEFLDRTSGTRDFTSGPGRVLATGPYQKTAETTAEVDLTALKSSLLNWARNCRRAKREAP